MTPLRKRIYNSDVTVPVITMRRNPVTVAWLVIWTAFGVFCFVCISSLFALNWYRANATASHDAKLDAIIGGTTSAQQSGKADWVVLNNGSPVRELDSVRTDRTGQALLTMFDGSTVLLYPDTEIQFSRLRISVFAPQANYLTLQMRRGKAVVGVARPAEGRTDFIVNLPQGRAVLLEGSYSLVADDRESEVKVRERGRAFVTAAGRSVELRERERADFSDQLGDPRPASEELVRNGDFQSQMTSWERDIDPFCAENTPSAAQITPVSDDNRPALRFFRTNSRGTPCEVLVHRDVNQDVSEFWTLKLAVDLKIMQQSLSGGGALGTEYPLMVKVRYRTVEGREEEVIRGFYFENPDRLRVDKGVPVPKGVWYRYLHEQDLMTLSPRPRQIIWVEIVASGHDYESLVRQVSLSGE